MLGQPSVRVTIHKAEVIFEAALLGETFLTCDVPVFQLASRSQVELRESNNSV